MLSIETENINCVDRIHFKFTEINIFPDQARMKVSLIPAALVTTARASLLGAAALMPMQVAHMLVMERVEWQFIL